MRGREGIWLEKSQQLELISHTNSHWLCTCSDTPVTKVTPDVDAADATTLKYTIETFRELNRPTETEKGTEAWRVPATPYPHLIQLMATALAIYLLNRNFRRKQKVMKYVRKKKTVPIKVNITRTHTQLNTHTPNVIIICPIRVQVDVKLH